MDKTVTPKITKISFFSRPGDKKAKQWREKILKWLKASHPKVKVSDKDYQALIVLGGDGAILEAARLCLKNNALILGLNLGTTGFLASVRQPKDFLKTLDKFFTGDFHITERMMLHAKVNRAGKTVLQTESLNEIMIFNPLGMVEIKVRVSGQEIQNIRGTGVMVATPTGSSAYNLSAHGPLVMPEAKNMILTEVLDHGLPTPSIVLSEDQEIEFHAVNYRERGLLSITGTGKKFDVLFVADGEIIYPLAKNDKVEIRLSPTRARLVEFEKNYFLKSLRDKFAFR